MTTDQFDPLTGRRMPVESQQHESDAGAYPDLSEVDPAVSENAYALDDTLPRPAASGRTDPNPTPAAAKPGPEAESSQPGRSRTSAGASSGAVGAPTTVTEAEAVLTLGDSGAAPDTSLASEAQHRSASAPS